MPQPEQTDKKSREVMCPTLHPTIEDAIKCAQISLGCRYMEMDPYWGTLRLNETKVVGYKLSDRKRFRLDFEPVGRDGAQAKYVHVNEENFDGTPDKQKICHLVDSKSYDQVRLYWDKWTSRYGRRT